MEYGKINIAVAGSISTDTGQKTQTLVEQINLIKGFNLKMFYNKDLKIAKEILKNSGLINDFNYAPNTDDIHLNSGGIYTDNIDVFTNYNDIDAYIITEINAKNATEIIYKCLSAGKKVINLNAVSEATLGIIFKDIASKNKTIYSVGAGDEPAVTLDLINYCELLGLEVICAGKGKNNMLNMYSNPDDFAKKVNEFDVNPYLITSFVDGTKTMLEMAILSNATGIEIDIDGMHGPEANVKDLIKVFDLKSNGGIINKYKVIDYAIGDVAPGVFVIFTSKQDSISRELKYLKMGLGPNFLLFKPYHLANIESPLSIYDVVLNNKPTLTVKDGFKTVVAARAKKDLPAGSSIDKAGGYTFSGYSIKFDNFIKNDFAPIGLVEDSVLKEEVKRDEIITFSKIDKYEDSYIYKLWKEQTNKF